MKFLPRKFCVFIEEAYREKSNSDSVTRWHGKRERERKRETTRFQAINNDA